MSESYLLHLLDCPLCQMAEDGAGERCEHGQALFDGLEVFMIMLDEDFEEDAE